MRYFNPVPKPSKKKKQKPARKSKASSAKQEIIEKRIESDKILMDGASSPREQKHYAAKLRKHAKKRRRPYGEKTKHDAGIWPDSGLEARLFRMLKDEEEKGRLRDVELQKQVPLTDARILYIADNKAFDLELNEPVWYEAKGAESASWRIKRRLWEHYGPGRLRIYKEVIGIDVYQEEIIPVSMRGKK